MEIKLKYGVNPNQTHARVLPAAHRPMPLRVLGGSPSYINVLDALRGWQLVRELHAAVGKPAAASFKHVSPAGAAVAGDLTDDFKRAHFYGDLADASPIATAYAKARSSDRAASFGDFIAVSDRVDASLAAIIRPEVSDGIIAPAYDDDALEVLKAKKSGGYVVLQMDATYASPAMESRTEFGLTLEQSHNDARIDRDLFDHIVTRDKTIPGAVMETLLVATITLKHTQSNSIAVGYQGQAVGIGAGQQSRIACTRLACDKADRWFLKMHPKALALRFKEGTPRPERVNLADQFVRWHELPQQERLLLQDQLDGGAAIDPITDTERQQWLRGRDGIVCSSDAFFPFRDNLDRAAASGVRYVAQAGGSKRDGAVIAAADEHGMTMALTGLRLFLH